MKKVFILMLGLLVFCGNACAFEVKFPLDPMWGTIGDSLMNDQPPVNSAFGGVLLSGGSNGSLTKAFTQLGKKTHTTAQAGATSFDQFMLDENGDLVLDQNGNPGIVFYGLEKQLDQLLAQTIWFDGISRLDTVAMGPMMNDCSHTRVCSYEDMDEYVAISISVATRAVNAGKEVIWLLPPEWDDLHIVEAMAFYGITQVINETDYNIWRNKNITGMCNMVGVECVDGLKNMSTDDGLHPTYGSYLKAAQKIISDEQ